jgi:dTDP-4-amino-4,6-dideoxygalactose transaminase
MIPAHTPPHNIREFVNAIIFLTKNRDAKRIFESIVTDLIHTENFVTLSSGRRALYLGLKGLGIKKNDEIILPAFTTNIVPMVVREAGAVPIPADVNIIDYNISAESVLECISSKTKAIIAVHTFGYPSQLRALREICEDKNLLLIEDAAQAFGAKLDREYVGTFGDIGIISFGIGKSISMCNGGMLISKEKRVKLLENKLSSRSSVNSITTCFTILGSIFLSNPMLYGLIGRKIKDMRVLHQYDHYKNELIDERAVSSFSYAIGIQELISNKLNKRIETALYYNKFLSRLEEIYPPVERINISSVYTRYFIRAESEIIRNAIAKRMNYEGIEILVPDQGYPISKTLYPKKLSGKMPVAEVLSKTLIGVPINTRLDQSILGTIFQ